MTTPRKFGSQSNRIGTGTVTPSESATKKWAGSVASQVATASNVKEVMAKTIPVDYVLCDPENPRKLELTQEQVSTIAKKYPIDKLKLDIEDSSEWIEDYLSQISTAENLKGKSLGDLASLVSFAGALKSADRLLHPIVVRREESTFYLIAGERRLLAHILLGESHIAAVIAEKKYSRDEIDALQWEENVHRLDMTLWERVDHIRKMLKATGGINNTSVTKLGKLIGRSRAESQRYLAVIRYPKPILLEAIKNGKVSDLKAAATLAQLSPKELAVRLAGNRPPKSVKPSITIHDKKNTKSFGQLISAAAKQLRIHESIKEIDLNSAAGINEALAILLAKVEETANG